MAANYYNYEEDESDMFGDELLSAAQNKDTVLFVIDVTPSMWHREADSDSFPVVEALRTALNMYKTKALTSPKDDVGMLFYGTNQMQNVHNAAHIFSYHQLMPVDVDRIKQLESLVQKMVNCQSGGNDAHQIWQKEFGASVGYGRGENYVTLGNVFGEVSFQLRNVWDKGKTSYSSKSMRPGVKRVIWLTNVDNPHSGDEALIRPAVRRGIDLCTVDGIRFELLGMDIDGDHLFDYSKFYKAILSSASEDDAVVDSFASYKSYVDLSLQVRKRKQPKRSIASLEFSITPTTKIGVRVYSMIIETKKNASGYMRSDNLQIAKPQTKWLPSQQQQTSQEQTQELADNAHDRSQDQSSQQPAYKLAYFQTYGGEKLIFSQEQVSAIRNPLSDMDLTGLTLLGFKPLSALTLDLNLKHSYFIYPEDRNYRGSKELFSVMAASMLQLQQYAIVAFQSRARSHPRLGALISQAEIVNENGIQDRPGGMQLIPLPFADDIRDLPQQTPIQADNQLLSAMKTKFQQMISIMKFDRLDPLEFPNPSLQRHNAIVETFALDYDEPPPIANDITLRNFDDFEIVRPIAQELMDLASSAVAGGEDEEHAKTTKKGKRKQASSSKPKAQKRKPKNKELDEEGDLNVNSYIASDEDLEFVVPDNDDVQTEGEYGHRPKKQRKTSSRAKPKHKIVDDDADEEELENVPGEDEDDDNALILQVKVANDKDQLNKLTVAELKDFLHAVKLKPHGRKADLIEQVKQHFGD
ncbi:hypothetical protein MIR68_009626 [Amoeboaphelidium protococcarum]|nr:hypothetical protein MIR68_009626 [Amoeboaphelidium protococcarum]